MMLFTFEDVREAACRGNLSMDCPRIVLQQNKAGVPPYTGPGTISITPDGLEFRMFADRRWLLRPYSPKSVGRVIEQEERYCIEASDMKGHTWKCDNVYPNGETDFRGLPGSLISGALWEIRCVVEEKYPIAGETVLDFRNSLEIPCNQVTHSIEKSRAGKRQSSSLNRAFIQRPQLSVHVHDEEWRSTVSARFDPLIGPERAELRLVEALQFVRALPTPWCFAATRTHDNVIVAIRNPQNYAGHKQFGRPIAYRGKWDQSKQVMDLFAKYLEFVLPFPKENEWHPLSRHLHMLFDAGQSEFDVRRLILGTVFEGILPLACPKVSDHSEQHRLAVQSMKEHVEAWTGITGCEEDKRLRERMDGFIASMGRRSAMDRVLSLENEGVLTKEERMAWKAIRNPAAHGRHLDISISQLTLDEISVVLAAVYKLAFRVIGWNGSRTDYSQYGWPIVGLPPELAETEEAPDWPDDGEFEEC